MTTNTLHLAKVTISADHVYYEAFDTREEAESYVAAQAAAYCDETRAVRAGAVACTLGPTWGCREYARLRGDAVVDWFERDTDGLPVVRLNSPRLVAADVKYQLGAVQRRLDRGDSPLQEFLDILTGLACRQLWLDPHGVAARVELFARHGITEQDQDRLESLIPGN